MLISAPRVIPATAGPLAGPAVEILAPGYVDVTGGVITEVGQGPPPLRPSLALDHGVLVPGLVDLQVNGYFGVSFQDADAQGWAAVSRRLPETGTTAYLPTLVTAPLPDLAAAARSAAAIIDGLAPGGARVLGLHLEGPFLAPSRRGAHPADAIIPPSPDAVTALMEAAGPALAVVTLAPETPGGLDAVARLAAAGVRVSVGHSDATAAQVSAAAQAGARMVTHLYNAQSPLRHREPGVVGQALTDPRLTAGLIADLRHVSAAACLIAFAAAPGRIFLVTDAVASAGQPPGRQRLGGEPVEIHGAPPLRLAGPPPGAPAGPRPGPGPELPDVVPAPVLADGTLAGSVLRLDQAVANLVAIGVPLPTVVTAATRVPADVIGCPWLGRLAPGAAADLTWLGDDLRTRATWVAGRQVYPGPLPANPVPATPPGTPCAGPPGPAAGSPSGPR
jgi:N-acetylglucosamine-6-phosphate deacetylase